MTNRPATTLGMQVRSFIQFEPTVKRISLPTSISALSLEPAQAAGWLTVLLVIAIGASVAQLTWLLVPTAAAPVAPPPAPKIASGGTAPRLGSLAALHLFGAPTATTQSTAQINAPETSLNLTLRGLFATARKEAAFAIIADGGGNEIPYRIGDGVPGGAVVQDILADRVVLERAGSYETLRLPKERMEGMAPAVAPTSRPALAPAAVSQLRELRESVKNNPQEIMKLAEMQPVVQDGQLRGYRIRPRRHMETFTAAGLTPNDVVTAVNGIPVNDPTQFGTLSEQLSNANILQLSVERPNGQREEISINLN